MKLNGWKRLGILASVLWVLGAFFHTFNSERNLDIKLAVETEEACISAHKGEDPNSQCREYEETFLARMLLGEREDAAIVALAPVLFAWGFVYLILFLARWVRRGFNTQGPKGVL